ncbi:MAG TPA: MarR family transcriptional regulator [Ilumatobacteraceae bacterium]
MSPRLPRDPIELARENWDREGWHAATEGMAAVTAIVRAQQLLVARVDEALQPFGLTFARYEVLMLLGFSRRGAMPAGKIGERLQVHPASVTNALNRLQRDGMIARRPNPLDARSVLAELTPKGRSTARRASDAVNRDVFESLPLSEDDLTVLSTVLRRLRCAFGDFDDHELVGRADDALG